MKWLANIFDPAHPNAPGLYSYSREALRDPALRRAEWQQHLDWVSCHTNGFIFGEPQGSETYTAPELKAMGMVGIYEETAADNKNKKSS